jgi:hypothetical protein
VLTFEPFDNGNKEDTQAGFQHTLHDLIVYYGSFGGWGPNVQAWAQRGAPTAIIKFEDLVSLSEPLSLIQNALETIGHTNSLPFVAQKPPSFEELHDQMPQFFRKGRIGSWKEEMSPDLHALFWEKHGAAMELMGYSQ